MRIADIYSASSGLELLTSKDQLAIIKEAVSSCIETVRRGSGPAIKQHVEDHLANKGWATNVRVDAERALTINSLHHSGIALQVQVGNVARAFYDLLKLESIVRLKKVRVGVLVVPTKVASRELGDNLSNFERLAGEHRDLFREIVTMPLVILGFE